MSKTKNHPDYALFLATTALLVFGVLILAGISANVSIKKFGNSTYYLFHQALFGILPGLILGVVCYKLNLNLFKKYAGIFILLSLGLMVLVFVPGLGVGAGGASRWLNFKFFTVQPSEFLKLSFTIYLAAWLSKRSEKGTAKKRGKNWRVTFIPFLFIVGVIMLILNFQKDLGTLIVIIASAFITYFSAGTPLWQNVIMFFSGAGLLYVFIIIFNYRINRIRVLFDPLVDPMGIGYQLKQAFIAIGSGGIFGLGLGMASNKIPQPISDSIFVAIAEELGFFGSLLLILFFLFFAWRGFKIAKNNSDRFSKLFAVGATSWITAQAFVNIGALIGIIPLTGIPLPFISYGGTHIITELAAMGIMLNISKNSRA